MSRSQPQLDAEALALFDEDDDPEEVRGGRAPIATCWINDLSEAEMEGRLGGG